MFVVSAFNRGEVILSLMQRPSVTRGVHSQAALLSQPGGVLAAER